MCCFIFRFCIFVNPRKATDRPIDRLDYTDGQYLLTRNINDFFTFFSNNLCVGWIELLRNANTPPLTSHSASFYATHTWGWFHFKENAYEFQHRSGFIWACLQCYSPILSFVNVNRRCAFGLSNPKKLSTLVLNEWLQDISLRRHSANFDVIHSFSESLKITFSAIHRQLFQFVCYGCLTHTNDSPTILLIKKILYKFYKQTISSLKNFILWNFIRFAPPFALKHRLLGPR